MIFAYRFDKYVYFFRSYLRSREDTVRSVVNSLLDDSPSELADELVKGECLQLDDGSADDETEDWEKWMPDPVDADPCKSRDFTSGVLKQPALCWLALLIVCWLCSVLNI